MKCDNALEQITKEVDDYEREQTRKVDNNELDILIESPSLRRYLFKTFGDIPDFTPQYGSVTDKKVIDELHTRGIETIASFEKIIPINFKEKYMKLRRPEYWTKRTYATGIVSWIIIIHDWQRYFDHACVDDGGVFDEHDANVFREFGVDPTKFPDKVRWEWDKVALSS